MLNKRLQILKYVVADVMAALIVWILFYTFRVEVVRLNFYPPGFMFWLTLGAYPVFWLFLHYLSGYYNTPFLKSRLSEFFTTLIITLIGSLVIFFVIILNDPVNGYQQYKESLIFIVIIQFVITYLFRFIITQHATHKFHKGEWGFNTLVIGTGSQAFNMTRELKQLTESLGYNVVGYVHIAGDCLIPKEEVLGEMEDISHIIKENEVVEILVDLDGVISKNDIFALLNQLYVYRLNIKMPSSLFDLLIGGARQSSIFSPPFVSITQSCMPEWEQNVKQVTDVVVSVFALIVLSPVLLFSAIRIKMDSEGPILFKQVRLGFNGIPFTMYKLRSMTNDAESESPMLSSKSDPRITSWGRVMRKYRIDEIPQFFNVIRGDMSIVGPRPERRYFADKIVEQVPYYNLIHRVKPGITSWGMVKFGYADTVDKMIERLQYELLYLENMSLAVDLKIVIYTIKTIFSGKGI